MPLEKGVGRNGGAEDQKLDGIAADPADVERIDDRLNRIARRRRGLAGDQRSGRSIQADEIGEGSAGINPDPDAHEHSLEIVPAWFRWSCRVIQYLFLGDPFPRELAR